MRTALVLILLAPLAGAGCDRASEPPRRAALATTAAPLPAPGALALPNEPGSIKFAVIGDSGRGSTEQYDVGRRMAEYRERFRFEFVLMLGDNIYPGPGGPLEYEERFEKPYEPLLRAGVDFYAALGNHDDPDQVRFPPFHMGGHRYYTFDKTGTGAFVERRRRARFFAVDTTRFDSAQRAWLERELSSSEADWKICFFHHPVYTAGRYGTWWTRRRLEPLLVRHGANVVFSGHDHLYVRLKPQAGIQYFVSGAAGSVRRGDFRPSAIAERGYDADLHFMLVEIAADALHFQAISRTGETVDAGAVRRDADSPE